MCRNSVRKKPLVSSSQFKVERRVVGEAIPQVVQDERAERTALPVLAPPVGEAAQARGDAEQRMERDLAAVQRALCAEESLAGCGGRALSAAPFQLCVHHAADAPTKSPAMLTSPACLQYSETVRSESTWYGY